MSEFRELYDHLRECVDSEQFIGVTEDGVEFNTFEWTFGLAVNAYKEYEDLNQKVEQLYTLFERVSGCEVSEFDESQIPYLADMIEGQMDANESCIDQLHKELKYVRELLKSCQGYVQDVPVLRVGVNKEVAKILKGE